VLATDTDVNKGGEAHVFRVEPNGTEAQYDANATESSEPAAKAPSTASLNSQADTNNSPASGPPSYAPPKNQATGTSGQNPAPRQQASTELPKTASPFQLIGLIGLLSLAGAFGLRLARNTY